MLFSDATLIIPGLWIGNSNSRRYINWIKRASIGLIVNCTPDLSVVEIDGVEHYRVAMIDGQKGIENWKSMCRGAFLIKKWKDKSNQSNVNILVHCHQGLNRSACVIACFLVKYLEWNSHQAIRWIQSRRPGSLNYLGFKKMIWKIEREKNISQTQDKNNNIN